MSQSLITQIEDSFSRLPVSEQLRLIERLVHRVQEETMRQESHALESQLTAMANDPQIQSELEKIEREFAHTEKDGLETT